MTGSGKTEIYIRAAEKTLDAGRTAIILVPEISLTTQIIDRFRQVRVRKDSRAPQPHDAGRKIRPVEEDKGRQGRHSHRSKIGGVRAAGRYRLIVIDEEHESTYKSDHTPKYDTTEVR